MATYVETKIKEALFARLAALVFTPALPVAYPNVSFTKPVGAYLDAKVFPNRTQQLSVATTGTRRYLGFLQVNVCWPANSGETAPSEAAGKIIDHFKRGTQISREGILVRMDTPPYAMTGFNDEDNGNRFTVPVTIPYQCFA